MTERDLETATFRMVSRWNQLMISNILPRLERLDRRLAIIEEVLDELVPMVLEKHKKNHKNDDVRPH